MFHRKVRVTLMAALVAWIAGFTAMAYGQTAAAVPTAEQLATLLAPIALYPDTLLAQICAASADPQQVMDVNAWLQHNSSLKGTALTDAAQKQGFDPAFIALVTFPTVLDQMTQHIDDYAAIGAAFKANQATVMSSIQSLRQQAYASGALDSNEYQKVTLEQQSGTTVVIVQPTNPQVVYVPQYQPEQVYSSGPTTEDVVAASLVSFTVGIAIGAIISNNQPWGWNSWGWGWGGGGMMYHGGPWGYHYHYVSAHPYYRPRPPYYGRPIYPRPPPNWNQRPGYRPPPPGYRPPGPNRPPNYRPPGNGGGNGRPPGNGNGGGIGRPPGNGGNPPGTIGGGNGRPPGNGGNNAGRPTTRPAPSNPYAGFPPGGGGGGRPSQTRQATGARPGGFTGSSGGGQSERAASSRGRASSGGGNRNGGRRR